MGGKIGNPQIRGKVAARSLPPSMLGVRSLVLPPSKLEVMSRGRSVAAVHGVKSQLSIEGGGVSKPPQWILSHFSFPDFSSHLWYYAEPSKCTCSLPLQAVWAVMQGGTGLGWLG